MSDMSNATPGNEGVAPAGGMTTSTAPATSPTAPAPSSSDAPDVFADLATDQAVFDRGYVERIRQEGAKYRNDNKAAADKLAPYESVFGVYDDADRAVWMDLARTWAQDPKRAAEAMQQIATGVLGEQQQQTPASGSPHAPDAGTDDADAELGELTPDKVQAMIAAEVDRREAARQEQAAINGVYDEMRTAGYDPTTPEGYMVLWHASNGGNGDVKYGVAQVEKYRQQIVDQYVQGRANGQHPIPTPGNGVVAQQDAPVLDLGQARKAADAYLRAQMGASNG